MVKVPIVAASALALTALLAPPVAAHTGVYENRVTNLIAHCGDSWHESSVYAGGTFREVGTSGTEAFRLVVQLQFAGGPEGPWTVDSRRQVRSSTFPDDSDNYVWEPVDLNGYTAFRLDATPAHQDLYIRPRLVFQFLSYTPGAARPFQVIHKHVAANPSCLVGNLPPPT